MSGTYNNNSKENIYNNILKTIVSYIVNNDISRKYSTLYPNSVINELVNYSLVSKYWNRFLSTEMTNQLFENFNEQFSMITQQQLPDENDENEKQIYKLIKHFESVKTCYNVQSLKETLEKFNFKKVILNITEGEDSYQSREALSILSSLPNNVELNLTFDDGDLNLNQYTDQDLSKIKCIKIEDYSDLQVLKSILNKPIIKEIIKKDLLEQYEFSINLEFDSNGETNEMETLKEIFGFVNENGEYKKSEQPSFNHLNKFILQSSVIKLLRYFDTKRRLMIEDGDAADVNHLQYNEDLIEIFSEFLAKDKTLTSLSIQHVCDNKQCKFCDGKSFTFLDQSNIYSEIKSILVNSSTLNNFEFHFNSGLESVDQKLIEGLTLSKSLKRIECSSKYFNQIINSVLIKNKSIRNLTTISNSLETIKNSLDNFMKLKNEINLYSLTFISYLEEQEKIDELFNSLTNIPLKEITIINNFVSNNSTPKYHKINNNSETIINLLYWS
ncbi:hypothetical protein ACTFIV_009959 [Dictyostelium citrinum]